MVCCRVPVRALFAALAVLCSCPVASSDLPHVRVDDRHLQGVLRWGSSRSPTIGQLMATLQESDVIAYLRCDPQLSHRTSGNLSFVTAAGGLRYVMIRIGCSGSHTKQTAVMGHELWHAIELAHLPDIVDEASFHREYQRIGRLSNFATTDHVISYETDAAVNVGKQVLRELRQYRHAE